jgi:F-box-like
MLAARLPHKFHSRMHPVLSIPELLDLIFSFMGRTSNTNNACVCKQWSEVALDNVWREVDDLHLLFSVLTPMRAVRGVYVSSCACSELFDPTYVSGVCEVTGSKGLDTVFKVFLSCTPASHSGRATRVSKCI